MYVIVKEFVQYSGYGRYLRLPDNNRTIRLDLYTGWRNPWTKQVATIHRAGPKPRNDLVSAMLIRLSMFKAFARCSFARCVERPLAVLDVGVGVHGMSAAEGNAGRALDYFRQRTSTMSDTVCAVVVSHNRKDLLRQCLSALMHQTFPVKEIIVVDNASSDGTKEMLAGEFQELTVENLEKNLGGAGGFHHGIASARAKGYDWIWVMDDDSLATPEALARLIAACGEQDDGVRPAILASKVVWTDGELHPMNKPVLKLEKSDDLFSCAARGLLPIRCASFVSVLIRGDIVDKHGLPFADYFIWNDDVEYTARILRENTGWWVSSSLVIHQTLDKVVKSEDIRINRYYYSIRNRLWMVRKSDAWSFMEKIKILKTVIVVAFRLPRRAGFRREVFSIIGRGLKDGLLTSPVK